MARILVGVSGGIAAYKALETVRLAVTSGHALRVIQTPVSERFVGRASFEAITGAPVLTSAFDTDPARGAYPGEPLPEHAPISHLALVERADAYLVAPASANTLAKLAHGHADTIVATAALAARCPVAVAPAMNHHMYLHPATQANLEILAGRGVTVIAPGEGALASHGERGIGRLPEPSELLAAVEALLSRDRSWSGRRVLVTAGGTREPIDSVRYIGNRSSGRMGLALAAAAAARGAAVTLVAANISLPAPQGVRQVSVSTAAELLEACRAAFAQTDVLLMAAAVADFRPAAPVAAKLKKTDPHAPKAITLEPTTDVLATLSAERRAAQVLVGFAAEHGDDAIEYGRAKLVRKRLDLVVVNDIARPDIGFDAEHNEVTLLRRDGSARLVSRATKAAVAETILDEIDALATSAGRIGSDGAAGAVPLGAATR